MEIERIQELKAQIEQQRTEIRNEIFDIVDKTKFKDIYVSSDLETVSISYFEDKKQMIFNNSTIKNLEKIGLVIDFIEFTQNKVFFKFEKFDLIAFKKIIKDLPQQYKNEIVAYIEALNKGVLNE